MEYGSLTNLAMSKNSNNDVPKTGDGATIIHYSDRTAATVIDVGTYRNATCIAIQEDHAIRTDNNGMSDCQSYEFKRNFEGAIHQVRWRKEAKNRKAGWYTFEIIPTEKGNRTAWGNRVSFGFRERYFDYSF
jgi:hypothetical protein